MHRNDKKGNKGNQDVIVLYSDKPTQFAHLGWRIAYTIIAWIILGQEISPGQSFFVSLILFSTPLAMEYLRFRPKAKFRKIIRLVGIMITGTWIIFGFIGMAGILEVIKSGNNLFVTFSKDFILNGTYIAKVVYIWSILSINVLLTIIDWIIYDNPLESEIEDTQKQSI